MRFCMSQVTPRGQDASSQGAMQFLPLLLAL